MTKPRTPDKTTSTGCIYQDPQFNNRGHNTPKPPGTLFDPDAPESFDGTPAAGKKDP